MRTRKHVWRAVFRKPGLATLLLSGIFLFAGASGVKANSWDDCNRRAANTDWRLHESIAHFGYYSPQTAYWRHQRHEAYERLRHYRHEWREHPRYYDGRWD